MIGALLAETRLSRANERALRARGAVVPPGDVYAAMAVVYPMSFLAMAAEGVWRSSNAGGAPDGPNWFVSGVLLFVASKALKYWAIRALGERWTFRVMVLPGVPLDRKSTRLNSSHGYISYAVFCLKKKKKNKLNTHKQHHARPDHILLHLFTTTDVAMPATDEPPRHPTLTHPLLNP